MQSAEARDARAAENFATSSVQVSVRSFRHVLIVAARRARANLRLNRLETEPPVAEEFPVSSLLSHVILENRSEATERLRALRTRSVSVDKRHTEIDHRTSACIAGYVKQPLVTGIRLTLPQ